ncbi:MAG: sugar porter family MFS transporter [Fibrobacter sp.]|nr:sugar porter family MFS transporter [Fibrobacter sp.]
MQSEKNFNLLYIALITAAAAIGGFLFGFDSSVINGANATLKAKFGISDYMLGWAVSLSLIGAAIGAYLAGRLADYFGRVHCMLAAALLFIASAIGSGAPFGIYDFIAWRLIGGMGIGIASIITPIYIAETSPASLRGRLGSMQQLAIVIGIFAALLSNYLIVWKAGSASNAVFGGFQAWQVMFWIEIIPAVIYGIAILLLPESPRYLVHKGRLNEARGILQKLHYDNADLVLYSINSSFKNKETARLADLFEFSDGTRRLAPIVWAGLGLAILQQLVGINVIFYYGTLLWQSVGFAEGDSFLFSLISSAINLVMTIIAILLIDKIGRKPLLVIGSIGMTCTLAVMGLCFSVGINANLGIIGESGLIALIASNLYVAFFAATWGPVMWVMLGEMFNNRIRAVAIAVCGLAQWLANFIVSFSFPILSGQDGIGPGPTYLLYSAFALFSLFFVIFYVPETNGKTLEQM